MHAVNRQRIAYQRLAVTSNVCQHGNLRAQKCRNVTTNYRCGIARAQTADNNFRAVRAACAVHGVARHSHMPRPPGTAWRRRTHIHMHSSHLWCDSVRFWWCIAARRGAPSSKADAAGLEGPRDVGLFVFARTLHVGPLCIQPTLRLRGAYVKAAADLLLLGVFIRGAHRCAL